MKTDANSDRAYEYIRRRIINGEYALGQRLMAKSIAEELKISPTPVRDALRQLAADGLVTLQPRMGAQVNAMRLKEFREMCELRLILESHTAALAAERRSDADLREIRSALEEMRRNALVLIENAEGAPQAMAGLSRADVQFHVAIMTAARNDLIRQEILRLHLINRVMARGAKAPALPTETDRLRNVITDHEAILEAIERQDAPAARVAMERSLADLINETLRILARYERDTLAREMTDPSLADLV